VQFDADGISVLFVPETLQLFRLSQAGGQVLAAARSGEPVEEVAARSGLAVEDLGRFVADAVKAVSKAPLAVRARVDPAPEAVIGPILPKLVFMVNNFCNLRCTYCYEHETVFKEKAGVMPRSVVDAALSSFYAAFQGCAELMFIGGEPTLSEDTIDYACQKATEFAQARNSVIRFSMITNGVRLTERMFSLIDQYDIQVTFSMDGPRSVHDSERLRPDGGGSYDQVLTNIRRYQEKRGDKLGVECTLTQIQGRKGVTVSELSRFFASEVGISAPHIAAAGLGPANPLNPFSPDSTRLEAEFKEAAATAMDGILSSLDARNSEPGAAEAVRPGLDLVSGMMRKLVRQRSVLEMCPAGTSQLVVDAGGDIYPCWMFAGMAQFRMGNVLRDEVFNDLARKVLARIIANDKRHNAQCRTCFARYACHVCLGNNQNGMGNMERIDENYCNVIRSTLEVVALKLGEAKADPAKWAAIRRGAGSSSDLHSDSMPC
jgi:uncharacterized protein